MGRFFVDLKLANSEDLVKMRNGLIAEKDVRRATVSGLVDSGATRLVISEKTASELGVREVGTIGVRYADRSSSTRKLVDDVRLELFGRKSTFRAIVEPDREKALIGAIVMEDLDLIINCTTQELRPRDPKHEISEIE